MAIAVACFVAPRRALAAPAAPVALAEPAKAAAPADEEAPDSPRASVRRFLELTARGQYREASFFVDVPRGDPAKGEEFARKVDAVIAHYLVLDPAQLSGASEGRKTDSLPAGTDEIGRIVDPSGRTIPIRMVRREARTETDEPRWVFSQATLVLVGPLYDHLGGQWVQRWVPEPLKRPSWKGLARWQWLALPVLALACVLVGRLLAFVTARALGLALRTPFWKELVPNLPAPLTLGWAAGLLTALVAPRLALSARGDEWVDGVARAAAFVALFWGLLRAVRAFSHTAAETAAPERRPTIRTLSTLTNSLARVALVASAVLVALTELGYQVGSLVAGLGIGGIALALAAQKTVENLFGSVSLLADGAFRVGDVIRFDGIEGTVERIGMRSTRVRTVERTVFVVPNGKLAEARIETLGARDKMRFAAKLSVDRDLSVETLEAFLAEARERLAALPRVGAVVAAFTAIGAESWDVDVSAYVDTRDDSTFRNTREEALRVLVGLLAEHGATLARPPRLVGTAAPR